MIDSVRSMGLREIWFFMFPCYLTLVFPIFFFVEFLFFIFFVLVWFQLSICRVLWRCQWEGVEIGADIPREESLPPSRKWWALMSDCSLFSFFFGRFFFYIFALPSLISLSSVGCCCPWSSAAVVGPVVNLDDSFTWNACNSACGVVRRVPEEPPRPQEGKRQGQESVEEEAWFGRIQRQKWRRA